MRETPIRVLIVEDNVRHAELMAEELQRMTMDDRTLRLDPIRTHCGEVPGSCGEPADIVLLDAGSNYAGSNCSRRCARSAGISPWSS
jgi:hypothetical protein